MKHAIVKFNAGDGALLCNSCNTIVAYGFDQEDEVHLCKVCKMKEGFHKRGDSIFHDQQEFLQAGDVEVGTLDAEKLADQLITEEYVELSNEDLWFSGIQDPATIKEALDLVYVTAQYLNVTIGPDKAKECWDALHANNMSKCHKGKLLKREDGKVLKPEGYKKLDLAPLLKNTDNND